MLDDPLERLHDAARRTRELARERAATGLGHDDADDDVGTIGTDGAVGFDPFPLLRALHANGVRAVVIGQVAGIMHGSTELTGDLDLLWDGDPAQAPALAAAFASVGARLADDVVLEPAAFLRPKVDFTSPGVGGDCCTPALPWGDLRVREFLDRAMTAVGPGGLEVHYLTRQDLIRMRRAVGRPKDLRRADELERLA
ncbi:hypothetical protein SAMN05421874_1031 [Nonomuraea maritima]|uniref:Nucleotidyltransferase n=1 Tax=Nonomuraea maritima TaxID=683260 RepID=A0A1G8W603_9ACTN|nr:hypothetical protein [Nonomuraea maritima]SDJ72950.1 hypothetical protein SAMN05421874_1031 [Nonomuraea maritima]